MNKEKKMETFDNTIRVLPHALDRIDFGLRFIYAEMIEINEKLDTGKDKSLNTKTISDDIITEKLVEEFEKLGARVVDVTPKKVDIKKKGVKK